MQANFICLSVFESKRVRTASTCFRSLLSRQSGFHEITFPASVNIWECIDPLHLIWDYFKSWRMTEREM